MESTLSQLFQVSSVEGIGALFLAFVLYVLFGLLPLVGALYLIYFLITLPMRRNERARMFLDLLELGLNEGRTPEAAIAEAAASHDRSLGARFHLLAPYLMAHMRLSQALEHVPRLLPPQTRAMLKAGERIGDLRKVLPACRLLLRDSVSQVRGAMNYLLVLLFVATPFTVFVPFFIRLKVLPAFNAIFAGMYEGANLPAFTRFVFVENSVFIGFQVGLCLLVWLATIIYLGGPRLRSWLDAVLMGSTSWIDWLVFHLPWRQKRLQRDFTAMLAALLEAGVPEPEAIRLAGDSTANVVLRRRAEEVCLRLNQGVTLPEALLVMDDTGELLWRIRNALRSGTAFARALGGWHETLDAKAFQLEQTAAQTATTFVVLVNGILVACLLIAIFLPLISLINKITLW